MLILMLALACPGRAAEADYVRLHVVAADDTVSAQALKLKVRDAVLTSARGVLKNADSADAAWRAINENISTLETAALECARKAGYSGPVRCETGVFPFPARVYGSAFVPAGEYRALRVVLGAGEGRNWWCVLYPSLCDPEAMEGRPVFYSAIWEWLKGWLGGGAA